MRRQSTVLLGLLLVLGALWSGCGRGNLPKAADSPSTRKTTSSGKVATTRFIVKLDEQPVAKDTDWWYAAFTPYGRKFVALGSIYDAQTGRRLARITRQDGGYTAAMVFAISPDGKTLAFADQGYRGTGNVEGWYGVSFASLADGKVQRTIDVPDIGINCIEFPDPSRVIALSTGNLYVLDVDKDKVQVTLKGVDYRNTAVSPDGKFYAQGHTRFPTDELGEAKAAPSSLRYKVTIHDVQSGEQLAEFPEKAGLVGWLGWTPDGHRILVDAQPRMAIIDMPCKTICEPEVGQWLPATPPRMASAHHALLVDPKYESNTLIDLDTGSVVPLLTPPGTLIIAISPDRKRVLARRYLPGTASPSQIFLGSIQSDSGPSD